MKLYLAGPMADLPDANYPAFMAEAHRLRNLGYNIVNPAEINVGERPEPLTFDYWRHCMVCDIRELITCDGVALLPNWKKSPGATLEYTIARNLRLHIVLASDLQHPGWNGNAQYLYPEHGPGIIGIFGQPSEHSRRVITGTEAEIRVSSPLG